MLVIMLATMTPIVLFTYTTEYLVIVALSSHCVLVVSAVCVASIASMNGINDHVVTSIAWVVSGFTSVCATLVLDAIAVSLISSLTSIASVCIMYSL
jgi:hypothetical protein